MQPAYTRIVTFLVLLAWGVTCLLSTTLWWFDRVAIPTWTLVLANVVIRSRQRMSPAATR